MPYADYLRDSFFGPLAMVDTGVRLDAHSDARARLAGGQIFAGLGWIDTWPWLLLDPTGPGAMGASGNIFSTAADMHRWNHALHTGTVLSPDGYRRLTTVVRDDYGLGISRRRDECPDHVGTIIGIPLGNSAESHLTRV